MAQTYIKFLFLPLVLILIFFILSLLTWRNRNRSLKWLILGLLAFILLSLPVVSQKLINPLQNIPPAIGIKREPSAAIVVLGGGRTFYAPEYQTPDDVNKETLVRIRYAAYLAKKSHLPLLVSGGRLFGEKLSEAQVMQRALERDFGVKVKWLEEESRNTQENAQKSLELLQKNKIKKIYLVTQAMHMRRSLLSFKNKEIEVVPAPTGFVNLLTPGGAVLDWIPSAATFANSNYAFYEYEGLVWYWWRYHLLRAKT